MIRSRLALVFATLLIAGPAAAASFDCAQARTQVEKLVCASPELSKADETLAAAFQAIGPEFPGNEWGRRAPRVDDQRRWLREVRDRCADAACLRNAYAARLAVLQRWHGPAPIDASLAGRYEFDTTVGVVNGESLEPQASADCLSLQARADGAFDVRISSVQTNGHTCWFAGRMRVDGERLLHVPGPDEDGPPLYEDEAPCEVSLHVEHGELRVEAGAAACGYYCGARARLDGLHFPRSMRKPGPATACAGLNEDAAP
jgi:uncharacterized protein